MTTTTHYIYFLYLRWYL